MPSKISQELISGKPETLSTAMAIAQDIFRAHDLGTQYKENQNNYNIRDDSAMEIDHIDINAINQQSFNNRNNYQRSFRNNFKGSNNNFRGNNNNFRGRNNNRGRLRYEWFKDKISKNTFDERIQNGVCVLCGSWKHIVYNCPDTTDLGKA